MNNKKVCAKCNKEFIPKQDWMTICPECFKEKKKLEYRQKVEDNKKKMKKLPPDPLNTIVLDFGLYKGCNLFQIYYADREYFRYLQEVINGFDRLKFNKLNRELLEELNTFRDRLCKYIIKECFRRLRKSLSNNESVYAKGIHSVGIEYGIEGQFHIEQILSYKPLLRLDNEPYWSIGIRLQSETFLNLMRRLYDLTDGEYSEYSCYTFF